MKESKRTNNEGRVQAERDRVDGITTCGTEPEQEVLYTAVMAPLGTGWLAQLAFTGTGDYTWPFLLHDRHSFKVLSFDVLRYEIRSTR
jgi:hypothetical protein